MKNDFFNYINQVKMTSKEWEGKQKKHSILQYQSNVTSAQKMCFNPLSETRNHAFHSLLGATEMSAINFVK